MRKVRVLMPFRYLDSALSVSTGTYKVKISGPLLPALNGAPPTIECFLIGPDDEKHGPIFRDEWTRLIADGFIEFG